MDSILTPPMTLGAPGYPISSSCARNPDEYLPHTFIVTYTSMYHSTQQASWHKRLSFRAVDLEVSKIANGGCTGKFHDPRAVGGPGYPNSSSCARNPNEYLPHTFI